MLFRPRLRRRLRPFRRPLLWALLVLFLVDAARILRSRGPAVRATAAAEGSGLTAGSRNTTVFIASVHRNTEAMLRAAWTDAVLRLVDELGGAANVYVSAVESGSQDGTKAALEDLRRQLAARGVEHTVALGTTVWEQLDELAAWPPADAAPADRPGWIWHAAEGHYALRRIPYLARVRNQAMAPLRALAGRRRFDRVLWINDVAFDTADVRTLLDTRGGHYAAACALDFKHAPLFYDTFALRDAEGNKAVSAQWPWFRAAAARAAVKAGRPLRVQSCWNGLVAFDARAFYGSEDDGGGRVPPLRFRGIDDRLAERHLEASECCLVHADNPASPFAAAGEPAGPADDVGVWVNPNVRVAYSVPVYAQVAAGTAPFPGAVAAVRGEWANRWNRAMSHVQFALEAQTVLARLQKWRAETPPGAPPRHEPGVSCLINEMQIMWQNGWKHL